MQPRFGIRSKLLLSILVILLISYSTLIYSTMRTMSASLHSEVDRNLETYLTYARSQFFDRSKIVKYSLLQPATSRIFLDHLIKGDRAWLGDRLRGLHRVLPYLDFLVLLDADKRVMASLRADQSGERLEVPGVVDQALAGKRAVVSNEILPGALLCRTGVGTYCALDGDSGALVTTVTVPVLDDDGRVVACIVAGEVLNERPALPNELQEVSGRDVEITVTQRDLRIASSLPRTLRDSSTLAPEVVEVLERGEVYRGEAIIGSRSYETVIDPILNSRGEFVGSLSVAVATERFKQNRRENLQNILASAAIGILCSFGLAFLASRHLTGPLRELASGASRIEEGDLDQRVEGRQDDEVGMLASSFNKMVQALKERDAIINRKTSDLQELNEQLERMVDERTAALAMEMGRLEAVLTSLAEGVVVTDLDNKVVLFNPAAQQLFELVPHRVVGKPIEQVCELVGFNPLLVRIREFSQAGAGGCREELTVKGKRLHVYLSSLADEKGSFAGIVFSIRDVTVEQQVDKMKTEFISTVSHELKTPLTSIKGALQLLLTRSKWLTDTERQLLTVCFRNTQRLIRLIGEILDISGIESGGMIFKFKPVSIGELAVYAVEEIKSYAMGRDITIVNTVGEHLPMVYGDSDRLIQVLTNLLSNAVKFSPEGKVVMISAEQEGNYVVVSVADKGRVIQWSDRDKLFKKFQQIECQERGKVGGTGLGLAICKEIVERHHGRIFYTAAQERGNTFSFTVPILGETDGKR